jgi:hypothetical protein
MAMTLAWIGAGAFAAIYFIDKVSSAKPPSESSPWQQQGTTNIDTFAARDLLSPKRFQELNDKPYQFVDSSRTLSRGISHPTVQPEDAPERKYMTLIMGALNGDVKAKERIALDNRMSILGNGTNIF